jgi:hypothetical protein
MGGRSRIQQRLEESQIQARIFELNVFQRFNSITNPSIGWSCTSSVGESKDNLRHLRNA